jgi:hypothetical protein
MNTVHRTFNKVQKGYNETSFASHFGAITHNQKAGLPVRRRVRRELSHAGTSGLATIAKHEQRRCCNDMFNVHLTRWSGIMNGKLE